jgi:hypothetical protein
MTSSGWRAVVAMLAAGRGEAQRVFRAGDEREDAGTVAGQHRIAVNAEADGHPAAAIRPAEAMVDVADGDEVAEPHPVDAEFGHQRPVARHQVLVDELGVQLGPRPHDARRQFHGHRTDDPPASTRRPNACARAGLVFLNSMRGVAVEAQAAAQSARICTVSPMVIRSSTSGSKSTSSRACSPVTMPRAPRARPLVTSASLPMQVR